MYWPLLRWCRPKNLWNCTQSWTLDLPRFAAFNSIVIKLNHLLHCLNWYWLVLWDASTNIEVFPIQTSIAKPRLKCPHLFSQCYVLSKDSRGIFKTCFFDVWVNKPSTKTRWAQTTVSLLEVPGFGFFHSGPNIYRGFEISKQLINLPKIS